MPCGGAGPRDPPGQAQPRDPGAVQVTCGHRHGGSRCLSPWPRPSRPLPGAQSDGDSGQGPKTKKKNRAGTHTFTPSPARPPAPTPAPSCCPVVPGTTARAVLGTLPRPHPAPAPARVPPHPDLGLGRGHPDRVPTRAAITRRTGHSDPREGPERARHMDGTAQTGPPRAPAWPREAPALEPDPQEQAATPDGTAEKPPTPGTEASGTPEPRDSPDPGPGAEGDAHPAPELLARAGRAHYIRHRAPPEWERLLSVREVFGHQEGCGGEGRGPGSPQPQREGVRNKTGEK
ncbi:coiled-coil domain-containing protein 190 isoform X1 [Sorex araneus]|uniref:coiled-coil domain-containing protein 190 isoform X1 n=1 Tax=Sorex araneus TaxID=42254 RepID=UPI002433459E|nr:coiled-coil domain-containing protein 190 isoform X1 [Sorex araneus]